MDVSEIMDAADDHGFSEYADATKLVYLNAVYHDLLHRESWPFLEAEANLTFIAGTATASSGWPTDFGKLLSLVSTTDGLPLVPMRKDELRKALPANLTDQGTPRLYYWTASTLSVWPVPDGTRTLKLEYVKQAADLSTGTLEAAILLPARHHDVLLLGLLERLALLDDDLQLSQHFKQLKDEKYERMREDLWRRNFDRPDTVLDLTADDYYEMG